AVSRIIRAQQFNSPGVGMNPDWAGMTGTGEAQLTGGNVSHQVKCRSHERLSSSAENRTQTAVDLSQKLSGISGNRHVFFHQSAHNSGYQGRSHAMAHDIAQEDAAGSIGDCKNVKKSPPTAAAGK